MHPNSQLNRQAGRLTYVEIIQDDLLGELLVIRDLPARRNSAPQMVRDVVLGELLIFSPGAPGDPRQTLAPPCATTRTTGEAR